MEWLKMYRYKTAEFSIGSWAKKVGKSLGMAYERGVNLSAVKRVIDKKVPGKGYTASVGNIAKGQLLSTPVWTNRVLKKQAEKNPINMVDRVAGVGATVKQAARNVRKVYIKGVKGREKVKWSNVVPTVIGAGGVVVGIGLNQRKKDKDSLTKGSIVARVKAYRSFSKQNRIKRSK